MLLLLIKKLAEAKMAAGKAEKAEEVQANINLYGYIVKLLVPGMSTNFEQNKGSIEFNIRVVTPKPNIAEPIATIPDYVPTFDKLPAVFECQISPYQPGQNVVEGVVMDAGGNRVASINFTPLDEIAGLGFSKPVANESRMYRATVDKTLPIGKYEYTVTHKMSGRQSRTPSRTIEVFKTSLTDQSERKIKNEIPIYAYYGYPLVFNAEASSGGKIKPNEFKIYITTDKDNQRAPIQGLSITNQAGIKFTTDMRKVNVRIAWVQPYTNNEVDLLPLTSFDVNQEEPSINANPKITYSGNATKFKVRVAGIGVVAPGTGDDSKPKATVSLAIKGDLEKVDGLGNYNVSAEPYLDGDTESGYSIEFEMQGKLDPGQTKIRGNLKLILTGVATNPVNGVKSRAENKEVLISIDFEPERGGPRRR